MAGTDHKRVHGNEDHRSEADVEAHSANANAHHPRTDTLSGSISPATDSIGALSTDEDWAGSTITITNPGRAVTVMAWGSCNADNEGGATGCLAFLRVGISLDGGSTYTFGNYPQVRVANATGCAREAGLAAQHIRSGTPTGDIKIKLGIRQNGATIGDVAWQNGMLSYLIVPA